jgi:hypothetical protein
MHFVDERRFAVLKYSKLKYLQEDWGDWLKDSCRYFSQKLFFLAEH